MLPRFISCCPLRANRGVYQGAISQRVGSLRPQPWRRQPLWFPILPQVRKKTEAGLQRAFGDRLRPDAAAPSNHIPRRSRTAHSNEPWRNWNEAGGDDDDTEFDYVVDKNLGDFCLEAAGGRHGGTQKEEAKSGSRLLRLDLVDLTGMAHRERERARVELEGREVCPPEKLPEARGCKATGGMEGGN